MFRSGRTLLVCLFAILGLALVAPSINHFIFGSSDIAAGGTDPRAAVGQWAGPYPLPVVAIHLNVLPDGRLLTWEDPYGAQDTGTTNPVPYPYVITIPPNSPPSAALKVPISSTNIFCAGQSFLSDGRLIAVGGTAGSVEGVGTVHTNFFDWRTNSWSAGPSMHGGRWYPLGLTLSDGEVMALSGTFNAAFAEQPLPEVSTGGVTAWRGLTTAEKQEPNGMAYYPHAFLAPNGQVFIAGQDNFGRYLDPTGTGSFTPVADSHYGFRGYGTAVLYGTGKVLILGGNKDLTKPPTNTAEVIDLTSPSPAWTYTSSMAFARRHVNATLLPDGTVLVTGGSCAPGDDNADCAVLAGEIWNPSTGRWTTMARMAHPRLYHSTAALLPDGRVISAGGTPSVPGTGPTIPQYRDADFFSPPYLFKGARPVISSAPSAATYAKSFFVGTPNAASITKVTWIRLSTVTHSFNMNQRINVLSFTRTSNGLQVTPPSDPRVCPPGHYMLFILNSLGVPSLARVIRISGTAPPPSVVRITSPSDGATVSGTTSVVVQVSAEVSFVDLYIDGEYLASSPPYTFSWNTTTEPNGTHTVSAAAYNSSSQKIGSAAITVYVKN